MNDSTLIPLRILVERAVRPVSGSTASKRKMREELLAHVTAVYQEEASRGDEANALERTAVRFGPPDELTRQLQAAVPATDRLSGFIEALIGFPPRGSKVRLALRHAGLVAVMMAVAAALMIAIQGHWREGATPKNQALMLIPVLLIPLYMSALIFAASWLAQAMVQTLLTPAAWRGWRTLGIGVAAWLLVPAFSFVWCYAISGRLMTTALDVLPLLLPGLLGPLVLAIAVAASLGEIRYCREWASLKLD